MTKAQAKEAQAEIRASLAVNLAALIGGGDIVALFSVRTGGAGLAPSLAAQIIANEEARAAEFQMAHARGGAE